MKPYKLEQTMRWYGPKDPVSLYDIRQAGCSGVVTALHHVAPGEVWTKKDINDHKRAIEEAGLAWTVVESLPVHEDIKMANGNCGLYIENYKQSIKNLGACGLKVITYNFMPILDWLRTDVAYELDNQSEALRFDMQEYQMFDLFILNRPGAKSEYDSIEYQELEEKYKSLSEHSKKRLFQNLLLGLPGDDNAFTTDQIFDLLEKYKHIDKDILKQNLISFLKEVVPVAQEARINLAIHPDDPPFSILGLPRIMSNNQDVKDIMGAVPDIANGLCFCTGSFGASPENDIVKMLKEWSSRIHFLHLRNTKRDEKGNFFEANHLEGDTDMYDVMYEVVNIMQRERRSIPMRPDHGHKILDDLKKVTYPGYSAIGRLKGLAELRGLEYGIHKFLSKSQNN